MMKRNFVGALAIFLAVSQISEASDTEDFVGIWSFHSVENLNESGEWEAVEPFKGAIGYLSYSSEGHMSYQIMMPNRPQFDGRPSGDDAIQMFRTFFSIFGTFEVDENAKTVTHKIEGHILPRNAGTAEVRNYILDGNKLMLSQREGSRFVWAK